MANTIEVSELRRSFEVGRRRSRRTVEAVRGITFDVAPGERVAFIGPNGAGKSTSIKMLSGILVPTAGTARVLGLVPWEQRRELTRRIGALFGQRSQLWAELDARSSMRMLGAIHRMDVADVDRRIEDLAELLGAADLFSQPVRTLSLGQRMRCELAASMLHRPELLFLDEPTIGLDLVGKQRFRDLLVRLNTDSGTTIFLTSHDVADIEHVAHRAIIINHGVVIHDAAVADMRNGLLGLKRIDVELVDPVDAGVISVVLGADAVEIAQPTPTHLSVEVDTSRRRIDDTLAALLGAVAVTDVSVSDPPLEHVIGEIYGRPA